MSQRTLLVAGIGSIKLVKRRGSRNLRVSIDASGNVKVSSPYWVPAKTTLTFIDTRKKWIIKQQALHSKPILEQGSRIGKSNRLEIVDNGQPSSPIKVKFLPTLIQIISGLPTNDVRLQSKATAACEKALREEAKVLLPQRLDQLASKHNFNYAKLSIKKLSGRWGSCSSAGNITLNLFLIQLPWELIDYVLLHELTHTRNPHHSKNFWRELCTALPTARDLQKDLRIHKPRVEPL